MGYVTNLVAWIFSDGPTADPYAIGSYHILDYSRGLTDRPTVVVITSRYQFYLGAGQLKCNYRGIDEEGLATCDRLTPVELFKGSSMWLDIFSQIVQISSND